MMKKIFIIILIVVLLFAQTIFFATKETVKADSNPHIGFFSPERVWTAAANANLNLRQPDPRSGDLLVATISIRPSASTINTPSGWTSLGSWTGTDGGSEAADAGSVRTYWFYKVADGTEGTGNVTFTENGTTSVWEGSIMQVRSATGTYEITAGGYSINGDTTNWGGTLDTDIGLTTGDLVLIAGAQNGNPSNSSAWNITATGISTKSTVVEHGEFSSNTGNDIEIGLASTLIWSGTNTDTPSVSLTQSVATSGTVTAVRIRQGSGTNRSDTWVRSAGSQIGGTTSVNVPYPEHEVGDMLLLFVGNKYDTSTPTTPSGWTSLGSFNGGVGTNTTDSGTARISVYYKEATGLLSGTQNVSIPSGNSSIGQMVSVHRDGVLTWTLDSDGGVDQTANTTWSTTGSGIDLDSSDGGDLVLVGSSINTDAYLYSSHSMSASGITFGDVTQTTEFRSTSGSDMTLEIATGRISSGNVSGASLTFTSTSSGSSANAPGGASSFIKIKANLASNTSFTFSGYRWYEDNDNSNPVEVWGSPDLAENTPITIVPVGFNPPDNETELRLRANFTINNSDLLSSTQQFKLQFKQGTDASCTTGSWTDVGGGQTWEYASSSITDGVDVSNLLSTTDVAGQYVKSSPTTLNTNSATIGQNIEYDFHIIGTNISDAKRYSFRVVESDGTIFDSYTVCPTLNTRPQTFQILRHGNSFVDEIEEGFFWVN